MMRCSISTDDVDALSVQPPADPLQARRHSAQRTSTAAQRAEARHPHHSPHSPHCPRHLLRRPTDSPTSAPVPSTPSPPALTASPLPQSNTGIPPPSPAGRLSSVVVRYENSPPPFNSRSITARDHVATMPRQHSSPSLSATDSFKRVRTRCTNDFPQNLSAK
jgi:hypothetical protein